MLRLIAVVVASTVLLAGAIEPSWGKQGGDATPVQEGSASASATGPESTASATATCPSGTRATGGGFVVPSSPEAVGLVYESVKIRQRAWRASAQVLDLGPPSSLTITTYVYCAAHFPPTATASTTVPTDGQTQLGPTASAACPTGRTAIAGGFRMPPPLSGFMVTSLYFDSLRNGPSAWDTRVVTGPAGTSTVTGEVYCAKHAGSPGQVSAASAPNSTDFERSTVTAACTPGAAPLAGGFSQPESDLNSFLFVDQSRRVSDGWQVSGLHTGMQPAVSLNAYGYCG
jgi:hypothetical protein